MADNTIIELQSQDNEVFEELLGRLDLEYSDIGDCFVNGILATKKTPIPKNSRIGIFPAM